MFFLRAKQSPPASTGESGAERRIGQEMDIRGQLCPSTLLTALKAVNEQRSGLRAGDLVLRFKTDNRDAITTIPDAVGNMGYAVRVTREDGYYVVEVTASVSSGSEPV